MRDSVQSSRYTAVVLNTNDETLIWGHCSGDASLSWEVHLSAIPDDSRKTIVDEYLSVTEIEISSGVSPHMHPHTIVSMFPLMTYTEKGVIFCQHRTCTAS